MLGKVVIKMVYNEYEQIGFAKKGGKKHPKKGRH